MNIAEGNKIDLYDIIGAIRTVQTTMCAGVDTLYNVSDKKDVHDRLDWMIEALKRNNRHLFQKKIMSGWNRNVDLMDDFMGNIFEQLNIATRDEFEGLLDVVFKQK
jgi:glutamate-1-semialdehyde aminotransferase